MKTQNSHRGRHSEAAPPVGVDGQEPPAFDGPAVEAQPAEPQPVSKDFGLWKYKPWAGLDRWIHEETRVETFDIRVARKRR